MNPQINMIKKKRFFVDSPKVQKVSFYNLLKRETREFCLNTSIHGCKYIAQTDKSVVTRFIWTIIMTLAFIFAFCLIKFAWAYDYANLTVTISDTIFNPIWNYHFPAVTICNINKMSLKKVTSFAEEIKLSNMTLEETIRLIRHLAQLQYSFYNPGYQNEYNLLQTILDNHNITVEEAMWKVRPDCEELLRTCLWKGRIWRCDSLFEESRSSLGICCSTNYYGFRNRTFKGYFSERYKTKPRKISACGSHSGLKVIVRNKPDDYYVSEAPTYGVKVLIHDALDFPGYAAQNAIVPSQTQYYITVAPILTYATDSFKALPIDDRGCVLDWERPMVIFSNYSWVNCLTECRIILMYKFCGCVPFFLRNIDMRWLPQDKPCTLRELECVAAHKERFINAMPELGLPFTVNKTECYCLPECEPKLYEIETSQNVLSRTHTVNERQFYSGINVRNHSVINVFFKDLVAKRNKRDVSISWYSEMALFGGLLGLCFGFSFTSGFEIVYTFTLKIFLDNIHQNTKVAPKHKFPNSKFIKKVKPVKKLPQIITLSSRDLDIKYNYKFKNDVLMN